MVAVELFAPPAAEQAPAKRALVTSARRKNACQRRDSDSRPGQTAKFAHFLNLVHLGRRDDLESLGCYRRPTVGARIVWCVLGATAVGNLLKFARSNYTRAAICQHHASHALAQCRGCATRAMRHLNGAVPPRIKRIGPELRRSWVHPFGFPTERQLHMRS